MRKATWRWTAGTLLSLGLGLVLSLTLSLTVGAARSDEGGLSPELVDSLQQWPGELAPLPPVTSPADNLQTPERVELGKMLFFDTRLSKDRSMSCASCHHPDKGYADGLPRAQGFLGKELGRHSPTVLNSAYNEPQFWDGRAKGLEAQAKGPILAEGEMNMGHSGLLLERLASVPEYQQRFKAAYGKLDFDNVARAIAAFERTLVTPNSRFDAYLSGQKEALSDAEKRGLGLYIGKASCTLCHNGANLTDNQFHNIGVPQVGPLASDAGRFEVSKRPADSGAFKTPTLRNLALTAPYMHNGAFATLEEVVAFYNRGGEQAAHKSELMTPLSLSAQEQTDLVAFLKALTGDLPRVSLPELPADPAS